MGHTLWLIHYNIIIILKSKRDILFIFKDNIKRVNNYIIHKRIYRTKYVLQNLLVCRKYIIRYVNFKFCMCSEELINFTKMLFFSTNTFSVGKNDFFFRPAVTDFSKKLRSNDLIHFGFVFIDIWITMATRK